MAATGGALSARFVPTVTLVGGKVPIVGAWINMEDSENALAID